MASFSLITCCLLCAPCVEVLLPLVEHSLLLLSLLLLLLLEEEVEGEGEGAEGYRAAPEKLEGGDTLGGAVWREGWGESLANRPLLLMLLLLMMLLGGM